MGADRDGRRREEGEHSKGRGEALCPASQLLIFAGP